ncbi:multicopper oxidase family protein [Nostoc sp. FACHB-145]|uniref:multicopper oxidase family protein n=1 Tax=Nostoc sp. FACHB-145 TaxID=2692836 RepID=UPI001686B47A|nr:multicopper oxidase family protein [Nostoc sp. FACHB-145]MBD2472757.1 multicopper oxidase domain-containing protein [Nostoc sp. FACHB-145]
MNKFVLKTLCTLAIVITLLLFPGGSLHAQAQSAPSNGIPSPACKEGRGTIDIRQYAGADFQNPDEVTSSNGVLKTALEVKYGQNKIAGCDVNLRSYNGKLVGPTLRVKKGDSIQITLKNSLSKLPTDTANLGLNDSTQLRGTYNVTNLHTHGLHVSPKGNSDNVLKEMVPGKSYNIAIQIPAEHPGGTNWYHPHLHHSTAMQVSSGMAGALIVEGGLDQLPEIAPAQEKIFVFQQISYGEDGRIRDYGRFGPGAWQKTGRQITVNGQLAPKITMRPGEVQHWRFIHAGIRETIDVQLQRGRQVLDQGDITDKDETAIHPVSSDKLIKLNEIAVDGIPLGHLDSWDTVELQPGYRSDLLVKIDEPGDYQLVDLPSPTGLTGAEKYGHLLATVEVKGDPVTMALPSEAELAAVKVAEVPPDITTEEVKGNQNVVFNLFCIPSTDCSGKIESVVFDVNDTPFDDPKKRTRFLELGKTEEWSLAVGKTPASVPGHPFHIHINPFQHIRLGPDGNKETIWRDTLLVVQGKPEKVRTRYTDFDGQFVLHCHILDHEDAGMMQLVNVVKPSQLPGNS